MIYIWLKTYLSLWISDESGAFQSDISKRRDPKLNSMTPFYCNLNELTLASLMFLANGLFLSFSHTVDYFFPFSDDQIGQSISSERRRMGCCRDRDRIGLNEALRNFHACLCVWCMDYVICTAWVHWRITVKTLRTQDRNQHFRTISHHQGGSGHMRLSLIGWVWGFLLEGFWSESTVRERQILLVQTAGGGGV